MFTDTLSFPQLIGSEQIGQRNVAGRMYRLLASSLRRIVSSLPFWRDYRPRHSGHRLCLRSSFRLVCMSLEAGRWRGFPFGAGALVFHLSRQLSRECFLSLFDGGDASCSRLAQYVHCLRGERERGADRIRLQ